MLSKDEIKQVKGDAAKLTDESAADLLKEAIGKLEFGPSDIEDLLFICGQIRTGHPEAAFTNASRLDTAVREEIPPEVWVYIGGELLGDES